VSSRTRWFTTPDPDIREPRTERDEIDPDNRLQPRFGPGPGEAFDRVAEAAGQHLRDLPRREQSDGVTRDRRQIVDRADHRDRFNEHGQL